MAGYISNRYIPRGPLPGTIVIETRHPHPLISRGETVIDERERLRRDFRSLPGWEGGRGDSVRKIPLDETAGTEKR